MYKKRTKTKLTKRHTTVWKNQIIRTKGSKSHQLRTRYKLKCISECRENEQKTHFSMTLCMDFDSYSHIHYETQAIDALAPPDCNMTHVRRVIM